MWRGNWSLAFSEQTAVVQGLMRILQSGKEDNWFLPCLVTAAGDLRLVASRLDKEPQQQSSSTESMFAKPREPLEKAGETLMACFRVISSERLLFIKYSLCIFVIVLSNFWNLRYLETYYLPVGLDFWPTLSCNFVKKF